MKPERLDRVALLAMTVYALGVLSWYLPSSFPGRRLALYLATAVALPMLVRALVRDIRKPLVTVTALLALAGCAPRSQPSARVPLTERQRDSVLAKSILPGATVVGGALDVSDRATDRSAELAAADSLFR